GNVLLVLDNHFETGIRFEGDEGWIFCTRGEDSGNGLPPLRASDKNLLSPLPATVLHWPASRRHHGNWLECILTRQPPVAPIQQSVRSLQACAAAWISMKLKRPVTWNAQTEDFVNDPAASALRHRTARKAEYDFQRLLAQAGLA
ncbi:MAG TPA: gfo/Idh/MocA family oxidoreductase, partial [Verrucomicrobiae bacterium]